MSTVSRIEVWYMVWNWALVTYAVLAFAALLYWVGPIVIANGMSRWEARQTMFRRTNIVAVPPEMPVTAATDELLGPLETRGRPDELRETFPIGRGAALYPARHP